MKNYNLKNIETGELETLHVDGRKGKPNHVWIELPNGDKYEMHPMVAAQLHGQIGYILARGEPAPSRDEE